MPIDRTATAFHTRKLGERGLADLEIEKLKALKTKGNFTNKKIAELTGISETTVSRIFSREGESKFRDVAAIAKVVGASLDDLAGIARHENEEIRELRLKVREQDVEIRSQAAVIVSHEREIARADRAADYLKRLVRILGTAVAVMVIAVMVILVFDVLNGDIGWARYSAYYPTGGISEVLEYIANIFKT